MKKKITVGRVARALTANMFAVGVGMLAIGCVVGVVGCVVK
jgi:hypothetical protein